jgi:hypothetical protein
LLKKHRDILVLNRDLLISGTVAFFVSAMATQLYAEHTNNSNINDVIVSIVSISSGYFVSIPLFTILFYFDNRGKYEDSSPVKNTNHRIMSLMIRKILAIRSVSELVYLFTRFVVVYNILLLTTIEPYLASMISSLSASALSYIVVNLSARNLKLFGSKIKHQ